MNIVSALLASGTVEVISAQQTISPSATLSSQTITPGYYRSTRVNIASALTIDINTGLAGQPHELEIHQPGTTHFAVTAGTSWAFTNSPTAYTATGTNAAVDRLQFQCSSVDTTKWVVLAISQGGTY